MDLVEFIDDNIRLNENGEPWILPLAGRLWKIIEQRAKARRLDCPYVFHNQGKKLGDFRKAWQTACVATGLGQFLEKGGRAGTAGRQEEKTAAEKLRGTHHSRFAPLRGS